MEIAKKIKRYNWLALLVTVIAFASCTHQNPNVFVDDDNDLPSRAEQKDSEAVREEEKTPEQAISVDAPDNVLSGDEFTITYTVNGDARKFSGPSFDGFTVLEWSTQSININGNQRTSISYTLVAGQEGTFDIDPATCTSNGKKITSPKISIHVAKPSAASRKPRLLCPKVSPSLSIRRFTMPFGDVSRTNTAFPPPTSTATPSPAVFLRNRFPKSSSNESMNSSMPLTWPALLRETPNRICNTPIN